MARFYHNIKANHSSETIHNCLFVDVETDQVRISQNEVRHVLREGVACYQARTSIGKWGKEHWLEFTRKEQFYDFLEHVQRPKTKLYVFCHNSNFDYPVLDLFRYLADHNYNLNMAVLSGPPTICRYKRDTSSIILLDTLNIWRVPLEKLGEIINCRKLPMPSKDASREQWIAYNRRDVEIIRRAVTRWADFLMFNNFGGFAPTLAGQSMRLYRHRFLTTKITIHSNEQALELERKCYHGGRNEVFKIGKITERVRVLDVNSMYPSVMQREEYPTKLKSYLKNPSIDSVRYFCNKYLCVGTFNIETDIPSYPYRQEGKLIFPVGEYVASISTPEIKYAIEHNHILNCKELAIYEKANIFKEFVNYLYNKRIQAEDSTDPTDSYLYKILLNSHYGKWGQKGYKSIQLGKQPTKAWKQYEVIDGETGKIVKYRQLGYDLEQITTQGSAREAFPAIAAHVTAYARMYLWRLIEHAAQENVLYCDTDSIICNDAGVERLRPFMDNNTLGMLKVEGTYTDGYIWACKDYMLGNKERHKGVKKRAKWITSTTVEQEQWSSLRGMLRQEQLSNPITRTIRKNLKRNYTKGMVTNNGVVRPYQLPLP